MIIALLVKSAGSKLSLDLNNPYTVTTLSNNPTSSCIAHVNTKAFKAQQKSLMTSGIGKKKLIRGNKRRNGKLD